MRTYTKTIILSLGLSIIPLILVAGIFLYNTQKELKGEIYERLNAVSVLKKNKLETFFSSRKEDLRAIQGFLDVQINLPTLQEFDRDRYSFAYSKARGQLDDQLRSFMNSYAYADIFLLDRKGKVVFVANPAYARTYFDRTFFNAGVLKKARKDIYISGPVATKDLKYPYILYMVLEAHDTQGQFSGYIVLEVDMNVVYGFISDNTGLGSTGETFLVKKTVLMPDTPSRSPGDEFLFISPLLYDAQAIFNKKAVLTFKTPPVDEKINESVDYRGDRVLSVWQDIPSLNWELITKIDKQEVFASIRNIRTLFFTVCLLILILVALGSLLFTEGILKQIQKLQAMSMHDPLTGVLNRRGFQDALSKTFAVGQRMGISVQALLLDLDNFKQINDRYGHGVGDAMLVAVTQMIQQTVRQTDYVARVGGDEFMVLLLDSREGDSVKVADKIRIAVAQTSAGVSFGDMVKTTCSIGIVPLGDKPVPVDELLQKLHLSLHLCKNKGKNRIAYQGEQVKIDLKDSDATSEFKRILTAGEKFYAASQPIFDLRNMTKVGFELLTRLDYEGYSSPDEFLLFARNANLLGIVDYACMKTCLKALKDVLIIKRIYINIFPSTLAEIPVDRLLRDFEFAGKNISFCIEINEQQILGDPLYLIPSVMRLKNAGIMVALDDYGFGYSSVETLVLLEPDIVKIDRKIVNGISKDARKFNSLKRLLRVIESCKASVIAEGIETKEDLEVLRNLGVTFGQGFLMGKPETPPHLI
jgi:diguanylate cyclase (GGDEF)-like protein